MSGVDSAALRALAERIARAAGDLVRDERPAAVDVASTKSSPTDVVTAMDLAAERLLRAELARERPDDGILGEEGGLVPGTSGLTWVLDPIDGTVNYLYGLPAYAVSVAVVRGGGEGEPTPATWTVLAGCVHSPVTGETWTASAGGGAWLDGELLAAAGPSPALSGALVGTGFGYRAQVRTAQAEAVAALLPQVRDIRRIGSAALDLCAVASGRLDAYYEWGLKPWDLAAGSLVVTEAGRVLADVPGGTLVAGSAPLVEELTALLAALPSPE